MRKSNRLVLFLFLVLVMALAAIPTFGADLDDLVQTDNSVTTKAALFYTDSPTAIPNQYIVVLKEATTSRGVESLMNQVALRGAKVDFVYESAIKGFAANLSPQAVDMLLKNDMVAYIEADQLLSLDVTWGLDRTDQRQLPLDNVFAPAGSYAGSGAGVHAYIVDTGVLLTHNEFSGRMGNGFDAVTSGGNANDCNGHGTHVAGTVAGTTYGLAPSATVHPVRVLSCSGSGSTSGVIAGVDWVANNHTAPAVANMSLGGGASSTLDNAVSNAVNAGVTFVVAAGNDNANACNYSPARVDNAITVGSTTSSDARSSFSNYGTCVDVFAPGSSITSAWHTGDSATNTISGTSMASPHVAGAAALYLGNNGGAAPATVFSAILGNATSGVISNVGSGSPNLLLFVGDGGPIPTPTPSPTPGPQTCTTYVSSDAPKAISSSGTPSVSSIVNVPSSGTVVDVNILDLNGTHTWVGDLDFNLISPAGTEVQVIAQACSSQDDFDLSLDDEAGSAMPCPPTGGGTHLPSSPLSSFDGQDSAGTWTLRIDDNANLDGGSLNGWSLEVCVAGVGPNPTNTPPAPTPTTPPATPTPTTVPPTPTTVPPTPTTVPPTPTPPPSGIVFSDDFEGGSSWTTNPNGSDDATTGLWEVGDPQQTTRSGNVMQLGTAVSGNNTLVTGRLAGNNVGTHDIDRGVTTVRSPSITLPSSGNLTLTFSYYLAHLNNSTSADYLRVEVEGSTTAVVFQELGAGNTDAASWQTATVDLSAYAGQTITLLISAADESNGSLVEAGIDDVVITFD